MNNEKSKVSGRMVADAFLAPRGSMVLLDPKGALAAVTANRTKKNGDGVMTLNPFVVLPLETFDPCGKWFRLCTTAQSAANEGAKEGMQ
jgi:hypothetical protein